MADTGPAAAPALPAAAGPGADQDLDAAIAALRARGADRLDPVRWRFIEALARRAAAHGGEARRLLDARLAQALAGFTPGPGPVGSGDADRLAGAPRSAGIGPLAELLRHIEQAGGWPEGEGPADAAGAGLAPATELKALRHFRNTWSLLRVDQQLARSQAKAPEQAGPLNSHRLVLRALQMMRGLSPDYLQRFMSYAEALLWLEQAGSPAVAAPPGTSRSEAGQPRKPTRRRSG